MVIRKKLVTSFIAGLALAFMGCGELLDKEEDEVDPDAQFVGGATGGVSSGKDIVLTGSLNLTSVALLGDITELEMMCVTFEETPRAGRSNFDATGAFSVTMYANVNFGCFINDKTSKKTVGSFVVSGGGEGLTGGESSSMALNQSLDLGSLSLGEDGKVLIPAATIAKAVSGVKGRIKLDDVHNSYYVMSCQNVGDDPTRLTQCEEFLANDGGQFGVYFRILKGAAADKEVLGMGIWQDAASFAACGGVDVTAADRASIEAEEGIVFSQIDAGPFTPDATTCPERDDGPDEGEQGAPQLTAEDEDKVDLEYYYALSKLTPTGAGFSFLDRNEYNEPNGTCKGSHSTAIEFSGTADVLYGSFNQSETKTGCGDEEDEKRFSSFNVVFTKQAATAAP